MLRWIAVWTLRGGLSLMAAFALVYLGDWAVFALRGAPKGTVTVERVLVVPLKGNKQEYVDQGGVTQPCATALFGQDGLDPCWQLRKNSRQEVRF